MELIDRYGIKRLALPLHQDLCRVHAKLNRIVEAEQSLAAAYRLQKKMCSSEGIYTMHVAAILKKQQKNSTQARDIFTKALSCARKLRQPFEEFMLFLELGMLKYEMGKKVDASSFLHQAVVLSRTYGYGYQLFKTAAQDIDIADDLLGLDRQYVLSLFRTSCVPYHLIEVHLCGTPRIMIDGIVIPTEWWKTIKALKLMCFLCMSTGKELSRETIIDALWKTAPLDRSARSFRKAVHFVRQCFQRALTVQRNPIVYKDDTYCIDEHFIVHSDFESMVGLLDEVNAQCDYTCIKENIKHVLTLSEKGIASNWFEDWIEDLRTQCSKLLEEKLVYAADQAQEEGDLKNSNNWLNVLINMNFYEEEYHWKLWKNYAALGRYNDIKKNYIELKHRIKKEFNLDLQPQTEKYYQRLLAASSTRM
jgi:DNA-binding SARP family transcriptional activator